jgi:hypothetical protein
MTRPCETFKVFGERNTSTNALVRLVEGNSRARALPSVFSELPGNRLGKAFGLASRLGLRELSERLVDRAFRGRPAAEAWKHCAADFDDVASLEGSLVVFMLRDPHSWILALRRRPYHGAPARSDGLEAFAATPWRLRERDRMPARTASPIGIYNAKLRSYLRLRGRLDGAGIPHAAIRFEDFARDQRAVFERLRPHLAGPAADPVPVASSTKRDAGKDADYYRRYYGEERWRAEIPDGARRLIDAGVDWEAAGAFGYAPAGAAPGYAATTMPP